MAHKRKDTFTKSPQWWVHLRDWKRIVSKAERRAAVKMIEEIKAEMTPDEVKGLGLSKSVSTMRKLKATEGEVVIPSGGYCYSSSGTCPYWDVAENKPEQGNGFCWYLGKGDWDEGMDLLWDQCKSCGVRCDWVPEGCSDPMEEKGFGA